MTYDTYSIQFTHSHSVSCFSLQCNLLFIQCVCVLKFECSHSHVLAAVNTFTMWYEHKTRISAPMWPMLLISGWMMQTSTYSIRFLERVSSWNVHSIFSDAIILFTGTQWAWLIVSSAHTMSLTVSLECESEQHRLPSLLCPLLSKFVLNVLASDFGRRATMERGLTRV